MTGMLAVEPKLFTLSEAFERFGDLPLVRFWTDPAPGTATEEDALRLSEAADKHLCELIDGILLEKTMGWYESQLALALGSLLYNFGNSLAVYSNPKVRNSA